MVLYKTLTIRLPSMPQLAKWQQGTPCNLCLTHGQCGRWRPAPCDKPINYANKEGCIGRSCDINTCKDGLGCRRRSLSLKLKVEKKL